MRKGRRTLRVGAPVLMAVFFAKACAGTLQTVPSATGIAESAPESVTVATPGAPLAGTAQMEPPAAWRSESYGRLPLHFEANQGQTDAQVAFLSRGSGYTLFLTASEAVLVLRKGEPTAGISAALSRSEELPGSVSGTVVRMSFVGAQPHPQVAGAEELPGRVNYFIGSDPSRWQSDIPTYANIAYQDVYPGIDLVYHGPQGRLQYDFIVRPGADPATIGLAFQGVERLELDADGDLVLHTAVGPVRQSKPFIYQDVDGGARREVAGGFVLHADRQVGFQVAAYDQSWPLVIDPTLFYSTYLGGSGFDQARGIAVDALGNAYVTGHTTSANFPTTAGAFQLPSGGDTDAFVTKLDPTGTALVYSTYLGGSLTEQAFGIAVDALANAYVTGVTSSANFPTTTGAVQPTFAGGLVGGGDAFVTKLNPTGAALVYSTYLGDSGNERGFGIAVDALGHAYVTGQTFSANFPITMDAFQPTFAGGIDAFVTKLDPTGTALVYSSYLGGSSSGADLGLGIAVDAHGYAYVTGLADSDDFPTTVDAYQPIHAGVRDAFVTKLNPTGTALVYSTYLGSSRSEEAFGIAVDALGNAYVTGRTNSTNFPTTAGAFQPTFAGVVDAFVTKLDPGGTALVYSTYLGGSGTEEAFGIAVDVLGSAYVTGLTSSTDFPTRAGAFQPTFAGGGDAFVTKLDPTGAALVYSTYLGGSGSDEGIGIALDALPVPNAYVAGHTASTNFPTTTGAFQEAFGGSTDAFVAKVTDIVPRTTVGKVTGGGSVDVPDGRGTFGFIVQQQAGDGSIHGQLQYANHATRARVHSVMFTTFVIAGNIAIFGGTCTSNGVPCTFVVEVMDNGEPGTDDAFRMTVNLGPPEGGTLRGGNIKIHD